MSLESCYFGINVTYRLEGCGVAPKANPTPYIFISFIGQCSDQLFILITQDKVNHLAQTACAAKNV